MTDQPSSPETAQEAQERAERRHPATVTADRLRAQSDDLRQDLTPREQEAILVVLTALDRIGG